MSKPIKIGDSLTFNVEGTEIVLTRVEPTFFSYQYGDKEHRTNEQKSRYAITVEGKLRGHIQVASGFGNPWHISALGTVRRWSYPFERRSAVSVYASSIRKAETRETRDDLVLHVPRLIAENYLPTQEEIEAGIVEYETEQARQKAETEANQARYAREHEAKQVAEAAARKEVYDTLIAIRDRLQSQMSNYEVEVLSGLAERYNG